MTIDEAIELKQKQFDDPYLAPKGKLAEADKLGIEALKEVKKSRTATYQPFIGILPGETKDK